MEYKETLFRLGKRQIKDSYRNSSAEILPESDKALNAKIEFAVKLIKLHAGRRGHIHILLPFSVLRSIINSLSGSNVRRT